MPDTEIAQLLKCSVVSVSTYRRNLGIPAHVRRGYKQDPAKVLTKIKLPEWVISKLGTMTDASLANLANVNHCNIYAARKKRGIASFSELSGHPTRFSPARTRPVLFPNEMAYLLGTMSDTALAAVIGIGKYAVAGARQRRGIPAFNPRNVRSLVVE